jgi:predicted HAD superfamily phosphohydrolase YqeG
MFRYQEVIEDSILVQEIRTFVFAEKIEHVIFDLFETLIFPICLDERICVSTGKSRLFKVLRSLIRILHSIILRISARELNASLIGRILWKIESKVLPHNSQHYVARRIFCSLLDEFSNAGISISIVSNTLLDPSKIMEILKTCGINGIQPLTSGDSGILKSQGLFRKCLEQTSFSSGNSIIIGDDAKEDLAVGESLAIKTFKVSRLYEKLDPILNKKQIELLNSSEVGLNYLRVFAKLINEDPCMDLGYAMGYFYSGLLANTTAREIVDISREAKITNLIFLSREGYLIKNAADKLVSFDDSKISTSYMFASRALLKSPNGKDFIRQQIKDMNLSSSSMIFDVGWRGKFLQSISSMIEPSPVMIMIGIWPWHAPPASIKTTYFGRNHPLNALRIRKSPEIVEFLLTAPHETMVTSEVRAISKTSWQSQIIDGAEKSPIHFVDPKIEKKLAYDLLTRLLSRPSCSQAQLFGEILHSIEGEAPKAIVDITSDGKILWIPGSKVLNKSNTWDRFSEIQRRIFSGLGTRLPISDK